MKKQDFGIHAPKTCGGAFTAAFTEANLPYLECDRCNHRIDDWIRWSEKYSTLWRDQDAWSDSKNHISCILGYFCSKYEEAYGMPYTLSLSPQGLFRGSEAVFCRRLLASFSNSAADTREYIDWYFVNKVQSRKKKITSMSVLLVPNVMGLFKHQAAKKQRITRSTPVPLKMLDWIRENAPSVLGMTQLIDFGDLQQLLRAAPTRRSSSPDLDRFIQELYKKKLIDNDLNIQGLEAE
jgi:hypothetical protein